MVKETVMMYKQSFEKMKKKSETFSYLSLIWYCDENAIDSEIACDCVKRANVVVSLRKENFARTHTATHKPTSAQRLIVTTMTHTW